MKLTKTLSALLLATTASVSQAAVLDFWATDGWNQVASEDQEGSFNYVNPGFGGQDFDAESMYYRFDQHTNVLSLGIQTGFDLEDGHVAYQGRDYYAGDLALSFNGSDYDYAVDFGLRTLDYSPANNHWGYSPSEVNTASGANGIDPAGFYSVSEWNNNIYYQAESSPFAMDEGSIVAGLLSNEVGFENSSYYRTVSFDLSSLGLGNEFEMAMHWTMSCGNDAVDAAVNVAEPDSAYLLGLGLFALVAVRRFKKA